MKGIFLKTIFSLMCLLTINSYGQIALKKYNLQNLKATILIPSDSEIAVAGDAVNGYSYEFDNGDIEISIGEIPVDEGTTTEVLEMLKELALEEGISSNLKTAISNNTKVYHTSGIVYDKDYDGDMLKMLMFFQSQIKSSRRIAIIINTYEVDNDVLDAIRKIADSFVLTGNQNFEYNVKSTPVAAASVKATSVNQSKGLLSSELVKGLGSMAKEHLAKGNKNAKLASSILGILGL